MDHDEWVADFTKWWNGHSSMLAVTGPVTRCNLAYEAFRAGWCAAAKSREGANSTQQAQEEPLRLCASGDHCNSQTGDGECSREGGCDWQR